MATYQDDGTAITLRRVSLGKRKIRYTTIATSKGSKEHSNVSDMLLFLGTDVLNKCGISDVKNLGRIHSKYSEEGLACKLFLPNGYQIKGIRGTADKAWFYSIHGLFRVAFRFYPRDEVKSLLEKFLKLWMAGAEDPLLQKTLVIDDIRDIFCEKSVSNMTADCAKSCYCKEGIIHVDKKLQHAKIIKRTEEKIDRETQCALDIEINECTERRHKALDYQTTPEEINPERQNPGCTTPEHNEDSGNSIAEIIETIKPNLLQVYKDEQGCGLVAPYIKSFVDLLIDEEINILEKQSTSFPIKLMKDYMDAKCNTQAGAPQDHELAIHIVSSWVGDRFYLFKDIIKHNIDSFKQTYINSISELPSPEEIVRTVYPSAMYSLIYLWIRGAGEDG